MMNKLITILFLSFIFSSHAQLELCGTEERIDSTFDSDKFQRFKQSFDLNNQNRSSIEVPIQVHIVRRDDGTGGFSTVALMASLNQLEKNFESIDLSFIQCSEIDYTNNTYIYEEFSLGNPKWAAKKSQEYPNVVNIFFLPTVETRGYTFFSSETSFEHIGIHNNSATNGSTLGHEMGHFFGLYHTHSTTNGVELVNGSNCETAGDLCCDTPADNNNWGGDFPSCAYESNTTDPNGDPYAPDPSNIMNGIPGHRLFCRNDFSRQQEIRMMFNLQEKRGYIKGCGESTGNDLRITIPEVESAQVYPGSNINVGSIHSYVGNQTTNMLNDIDLSYFLSLDCELSAEDILLGSSISKMGRDIPVVLETEKLTIPSNTQTGVYYILFVSDYGQNLAESDETNNIECVEIDIIKNDLGVNANLLIENIKLYPNPISNVLSYSLPENTKIDRIELVSVLGQQLTVFEINESKELDFSSLSKGIYFIRFTNYDKEQATIKIIKD